MPLWTSLGQSSTLTGWQRAQMPLRTSLGQRSTLTGWQRAMTEAESESCFCVWWRLVASASASLRSSTSEMLT